MTEDSRVQGVGSGVSYGLVHWSLGSEAKNIAKNHFLVHWSLGSEAKNIAKNHVKPCSTCEQP